MGSDARLRLPRAASRCLARLLSLASHLMEEGPLSSCADQVIEKIVAFRAFDISQIVCTQPLAISHVLQSSTPVVDFLCNSQWLHHLTFTFAEQ